MIHLQGTGSEEMTQIQADNKALYQKVINNNKYIHPYFHVAETVTWIF